MPVHYDTTWRKATPLPQTFKMRLRNLARNILITTLSVFNKKNDDKFLRSLYCHHIFDDQKEIFEEIIIALKNTGTFINTDTCLEMATGKREIDGPYFHLTFDDGFRNIYTNGFPILKKYNIPAILFIPTSFIDAGMDEAKYYCKNVINSPWIIEILRWEDLREMIARGIEVGSHTRTHARFSAISHNTSLLEKEIIGSQIDIKEKLNYDCKYIAWTYGQKEDADETSLKMVKRAGYHACFGGYRGTIKKGNNLYVLPRHHFDLHWPISHIKYFSRGNFENKKKQFNL